MTKFIYISGPIAGIDDYRENFKEAEERIHRFCPDCITINPAAMIEGDCDSRDIERILDIELEIVRSCDVIYMMDGWVNSVGAKRELMAAIEEDKMILIGSDPDVENDLRDLFDHETVGRSL